MQLPKHTLRREPGHRHFIIMEEVQSPRACVPARYARSTSTSTQLAEHECPCHRAVSTLCPALPASGAGSSQTLRVGPRGPGTPASGRGLRRFSYSFINTSLCGSRRSRRNHCTGKGSQGSLPPSHSDLGGPASNLGPSAAMSNSRQLSTTHSAVSPAADRLPGFAFKQVFLGRPSYRSARIRSNSQGPQFTTNGCLREQP